MENAHKNADVYERREKIKEFVIINEFHIYIYTKKRSKKNGKYVYLGNLNSLPLYESTAVTAIIVVAKLLNTKGDGIIEKKEKEKKFCKTRFFVTKLSRRFFSLCVCGHIHI